MKCKNCDGDGVIVDVEYGHAGKYGCKYCDGKGVVEPLTEEEYLRSCTTEQLAEVIGNIAKNAYQCCQDGKTNKCVNRHNCTGYCNYGWEMWLKQPHTFK